ncbi:TonB-dependent siderophore receptor [Herbaspirillum lusitanum]|uniref:TonB-dependent siderophore receptor n=1 Tax=Herbaspirillum lusitanum TaxID=213312 RepID=A0ABW9A9T4_9BURK
MTNVGAATSVAQQQVPQAPARIEFSIAPASLSQVLGSFATRAGITLSYQPSIAAGKSSAGLQGRHSVSEGLEIVLRGTGIRAVMQGKGDFVLQLLTPPDGEKLTQPVQRMQQESSLPMVTVRPAAAGNGAGAETQPHKLTASLLDTPRSVTVIPAELIKDMQAGSVADVLRSIPGITFKGADALGAPGGDRPFIRGFDSSNSLFVDGMRSPGAQSREVFAVEQIEVIEGPGSIYSGRGAGGGSVNIVSKTPQADNFFDASLGVGSADYRRSTVDVNRRMDDTSAARLNLMWQDSAKAGREQVSYGRWGVAPSLSFGLNTPTRVTLSYYHLQTDDMPDYSVPYAQGGGAPINVGRDRFYGLLSRDFIRSSADIAQVEVVHKLDGGMRLRNLTQYSASAMDFIATNPQWAGTGSGSDLLQLQAKSAVFDMRAMSNQTQLSGDFATGAVSHRFVAGLELSRERGQRSNYDVRDSAGNDIISGAGCEVAYNCTSLYGWNPAGPWTGSVAQPDSATGVLTTTSDTVSLYAADTGTLSPRWLLNSGLRYDRFSTSTEGASSLSKRSAFWSYQLGLIFKPADNLSVYGTLSTAANPVGSDSGQGSDVISAANQDLEPERIRNIEAGVKWDVGNAPGRSMVLSAAMFRAVKTNARISIGRGSVNGGTQTVKGLVLGARGNISADWSMAAGYSYLDSRINDDGPTSANDGNIFPLTPRRSLTLWSGYRLPAGFRVGAGLTYSDRLYANSANTNYVPAYTKFDAMLAWQANANLELQLNLYNLTDKLYYDSSYPVYATIAAGRSAVLSAHFRY